MTLRNCWILTPAGLVKGNLVAGEGIIRRVGGEAGASGEVYEAEGLYAVPGFREQHLHDLPGMTRWLEKPERIGAVSRCLAEQGVTAFKLATVAMPAEDLVKYLETCREGLRCGRPTGARFEGVFVEGTFINRECAGAQPPEYIVQPNEPGARQLLDKIIESGVVRLVNIAPEFGVELVGYAAGHGLIVGCGHSRASACQLAEAMAAGLRFIVHITNGAMGQSFKPFGGGGTYEGALVLPLHVEFIADGLHMDFRYVSDIVERRLQKGRGGELIAVTDRMFACPSDVPEGEFRVFNVVCCKPGGEDVLYARGFYSGGEFTEAPPNTLCGSLLTMPKAFENILNMLARGHSGFMIDAPARPFEEALALASAFTSKNQAGLEGRSDVGVLEPGRRADVTLLSIVDSGEGYRVRVEATVVDGEIVFAR